MENLFRIIGYTLLIIINGILYWFLHSHFHFMVLVIMILAPVFSILTALHLRKKISADISFMGAPGEYGSQGEEAFFLIKLNNPTWWVSLDIKLNFVAKNTFFGTAGEFAMSVPVYSKKGYELVLPLKAQLPGLVELELTNIKIKDLMGFGFFNKKLNVKGEAIVMPQVITEQSYDKTSLETGMLESEESTRRGNDFSDVQEIREYIPGDKLMSIHWKLSAKRDILMVKDRVSMSDRQLVVLPELCNQNIIDLNIILVSTYSLIARLIEDKLTVRLLYWSKNRYEYEEVRIDYLSSLKEAFAKMFYESCYEDINEAAAHMSMVHPEMKSYLHISAEGGQAFIRVRENG